MNYTAVAGGTTVPTTGNNFNDIFKQYERVLVESLVTAFGLDAILQQHDQLGGDVDTIHNVRQIGKDGSEMQYKNAGNLAAYECRGDYDSHAYHSHPEYIRINRGISEQKRAGTLTDAYTGERIAPNEKTDLDHIISAKEIHDDRGRVLAGIEGAELANKESNLRATNPHTNRTKKAKTMDEFLEQRGDEYTPEQIEKMKRLDSQSRETYNHTIEKEYYTSPKFQKDMAAAAGKVGARMAARQAIGFVFAEIWFAVKAEFQLNHKMDTDSDFGQFVQKIGNGIKTGFENAKRKYKEILQKTLDGAVSGVLASVTTTIANIFFTTSKNVVTLIRQVYASFVEAVKVLVLNPDDLPLGDKLRAVAKIISTGASVAVGVVVNLAIAETPLGKIPVIGDIVQTFCGTLVTGIMSCTLLMFFDRSKVVNQLVEFLNTYSMHNVVEYFKEVGVALEKYAAELMKLDAAKFSKETKRFSALTSKIDSISSDREMNETLKRFYAETGLPTPWKGDFNTFMGNRNNRLVFE